MPSTPALIVIFNHKYNQNIEVLRNLYKGRFSHVFFLVPFYEGLEPDIIPVYENSFYFQGYLAQGFKHYFNDLFTHYLFVADDMVLNPAINETNYQQYFNITANENFLPEILPLHRFKDTGTLVSKKIHTLKKNVYRNHWWRVRLAYEYTLNVRGVEAGNELPTYEQAAASFLKHGITIEPLDYYDMYGGVLAHTSYRYKVKQLFQILRRANKIKKRFPLPYPIAASYADLIVVNKATIERFVHYCGVFAATRLFVELAIPTALLLCPDAIITEADTDTKGLLYWGNNKTDTDKYEADMQQYGYDLQQLIQHFPVNKLYIHPVKLSKWKK